MVDLIRHPTQQHLDLKHTSYPSQPLRWKLDVTSIEARDTNMRLMAWPSILGRICTMRRSTVTDPFANKLKTRIDHHFQMLADLYFIDEMDQTHGYESASKWIPPSPYEKSDFLDDSLNRPISHSPLSPD